MGHWAYMPFLLAWALPVVVFQWLVGGRYLWRERRRWPWIVLGLTVYFTLADAVAIQAHIWSFDRTALVGVYLGPVPVEETLFYLLTAAMVVQGYVLFWAAWVDRHSLGAICSQRLNRMRRGLRGRRQSLTSAAPPAGPLSLEPPPQNPARESRAGAPPLYSSPKNAGETVGTPDA